MKLKNDLKQYLQFVLCDIFTMHYSDFGFNEFHAFLTLLHDEVDASSDFFFIA